MHKDLMPAGNADAINLLLSEHELIKRWLSRLRQAQERAERLECVKTLRRLFALHNTTEAHVVYPALHELAGNDGDPMKLYRETAEADVMLFELDFMLQTCDGEGFSKKAERLCDAVVEHIEDEEMKAFPALREAAGTDRMRLLDRVVHEFRAELMREGEASRERVTSERGQVSSKGKIS